MHALRTWLKQNTVLLGIVGGGSVAIISLTIFVGLVTSRFLGGIEGFFLAATVAGVCVTWASFLWSRVEIVQA